jgi:dUTP pyrophosphatase
METNSFCENFLNSGKSEKIMHLKIFVDGPDELKQIYRLKAENHNNNLINNLFIDAGFDIVTPLQSEDTKEEVIKCYGTNNIQNKNPVNKIDFKIKCSARMMVDINKSNNILKYFYTGFYLDPRSSISKTKLRLANSRGIIDAGYRGNLIGMFDVVNLDSLKNEFQNQDADYYIKKYECLVQICAPGLVPIFVEIVDNLEDLGSNTERGEKGFGSTSKI